MHPLRTDRKADLERGGDNREEARAELAEACFHLGSLTEEVGAARRGRQCVPAGRVRPRTTRPRAPYVGPLCGPPGRHARSARFPLPRAVEPL